MCENPHKKCEEDKVAVFVYYKGQKLGLCWNCWKEWVKKERW